MTCCVERVGLMRCCFACRRTYDKRLHAYDAAKGRYLALVKETKAEVLAAAEEELRPFFH